MQRDEKDWLGRNDSRVAAAEVENARQFWKAVRKGGSISAPKRNASCHNICRETKCRIEEHIFWNCLKMAYEKALFLPVFDFKANLFHHLI